MFVHSGYVMSSQHYLHQSDCLCVQNTTYTPQRFEVVCVCFHSLCCQPKQSVCLCVSPEHDLHPREVHGVVDEHSREDRATQERGGPAGASQGLH